MIVMSVSPDLVLADKLSSIGDPCLRKTKWSLCWVACHIPLLLLLATALGERSDGLTMNCVQEMVVHYEQKLKSKEGSTGGVCSQHMALLSAM